MNKVLGFIYILIFYFLGYLISYYFLKSIPGSVIGMVLFFLALSFKIIDPGKVRKISLSLTKNISLFFIPAGVGVMTLSDIISDNWFFIIFSTLTSTILVLLSVGFIQQKMGKLKND